MSFEPDFRLRFLDDLIEQHANIAGDIVEIGLDTWAIHGTIPADGNVLMASFEQQRDAMAVLHQLGPNVSDDAPLGDRQRDARVPTEENRARTEPDDRPRARSVRRVGELEPGRPGSPGELASRRSGSERTAKRRW
jgi:hypothetical protein